MTHDWAADVAAAPPSLVLPVRPRGADVAVPGPLSLLDLLELGEGHAVGIVEDGSGARWTVPLVRDSGGLRRSVAGDGTAQRLVERLPDPGSEAFRTTSWHAEPVAGERAVTVDQTNESVVVGERAVVKWAVRLPDGGAPGSPAAQRLSALATGGFEAMPRPWGMLEARGVLVASVVDLLPGAVDGWEWAVDDVRRLARGELSQNEALEPTRRLGGITAQMHLALSGTGRDAAEDATVAAWLDRARAELDDALGAVGGPEGDRLAARAGRIASSYDGFEECVGTPLVDVHGDLHVGQVLRHGEPHDYAVTDFDGNPVLSAADRVARQPAAVDVAGMLASLDHVGRVVVFRTEGVDADMVTSWITHAQAAFLDSYRTTLAEAGASDLLDERLLAPLRLQQEVREHLYAVRHLPHWVYVPDLALADLLPDED